MIGTDLSQKISTAKPYVIGFIVGLLLGCCIGYFTHPDATTEYVKGDPQITKETVYQKGETEIQYIPKTSANDADVEMSDAPQQVSVMVNGKKTNFNTVAGETQKFEKGKLVVDRTSSIQFDIKAPEQPAIEGFINGTYDIKDKKYGAELQGIARKNGWKAEATLDTSGRSFLKLGHTI